MLKYIEDRKKIISILKLNKSKKYAYVILNSYSKSITGYTHNIYIEIKTL